MKLKKFLVVAMSVAMTFAMSTTAFAEISTAEQKLIDKVAAGITTDSGFEFTPTADQISELEGYFEANDEFEASTIEEIIADIDEVIAVLEENQISSIEELKNSDILETVTTMVMESAAKVDIKVEITDDGVVITDSEGNPLVGDEDGIVVGDDDATESGDANPAPGDQGGDTVGGGDTTIEKTGFSLASTITVLAIFAVAFTGCAVYTKKRVA